MTMKDSFFLDTNILIYLIDKNSSFNSSTLKIISELIKQKKKLYISRQVLREFSVISTRTNLEKKISKNEYFTYIAKFTRLFIILDETEDTTSNLLNLIKNYDISGKRIHDANIVATMVENNIKYLLTLNIKDFKNFKEIELINIK